MDRCDQWVRDQEKAKAQGDKRTLPGAGGEEEDDSGTGSGDDDDADEPPAKRIRLALDEGDFPWVKRDALIGTEPLRADLAETVRLLGLYGVDTKRTLRSLLARTRVEFPESQWLRLLTNKAVDLDAVLAGIYSISPSTAHTESIGNLDLTFNGSSSSKPTRTVVTQSDWTIAWMQTVEAGLTVFPHLSTQYREWGLFILGKFAAVHDTQHHRIIAFEKAGRLLVSRRADVGLDQFHHFSALETMHLNSMGRLAVESSSEGNGRPKTQSPNGAGGGRGSAKKPLPPKGKSNEPCRLWNAGRCKRDDCRHLHVCTGCRKNHPESECPK
ncbi:hypothetical protein B0H14DRAFT_2405094 [Mycena olivaceomarginata]|nr:hypothetical protein B0H14DRAFT_2405094 [Mycena olivaceomarginata]